MAILEERHDEGDHYIILVPNSEFSGRRLVSSGAPVQFINGEGRTALREVAQELEEAFGYDVVLPVGVEPWEHASTPDPAKRNPFMAQPEPVVVSGKRKAA